MMRYFHFIKIVRAIVHKNEGLDKPTFAEQETRADGAIFTSAMVPSMGGAVCGRRLARTPQRQEVKKIA
jgi:hypothetical protein